MEEERYAMKIREAGEQMRSAEEEIGRAEATEKMVYAKAMVVAEGEGHKTAAAQMRFADLQGEVYNARVNRGVAKGMLAAVSFLAPFEERPACLWGKLTAPTRTLHATRPNPAPWCG